MGTDGARGRAACAGGVMHRQSGDRPAMQDLPILQRGRGREIRRGAKSGLGGPRCGQLENGWGESRREPGNLDAQEGWGGSLASKAN